AGAYVKLGKDIQEERLLSGALPVSGETGAEPEEMWGRIHRGDASEPVPTIPGDWSIFYRQLVEHLRADGPVPVSAADATRVMEVLDAARKSSS
ncbi:oxidoreductase, partial [Enterococcus hirae]